MDEQRFRTLNRQVTLLDHNDEYRRGYLRGLRRKFHGDAFGTERDHTLWMSMANDPLREQLGRGYRDGFEGREPSGLSSKEEPAAPTSC